MGRKRPPTGGLLKRLFRGHPCRDYARYHRSIETIFATLLPNWSPTSQRRIEEATGIPHQRLYSWKQKWANNPNWRPWNSQAHGAHHRIFTPEEECAISNHIIDCYITPGLLLTGATFVEIAVQAFLEKDKDSEPIIEFQFFPRFISDFKRSNRFSSRRAHLKRSPTVTIEDHQHWIRTLAQLLHEIPSHERIIKVDESCWRVLPNSLQIGLLLEAKTSGC
jgi:hypothetical protein